MRQGAVLAGDPDRIQADRSLRVLHISRVKKVMPGGRIAVPTEVRFWRHVNRNGPQVWDGHGVCWQWDASDQEGYGCFGSKEDGYRTKLAHKYSYLLHYGIHSIPHGFQVDHLCRNRGCVRPDHLEAVTPWVNVMRSNSITAAFARKTHCPSGHPYDDVNTRISSDGRRYCRACKREKARTPAYRAKQRIRDHARHERNRTRNTTEGR